MLFDIVRNIHAGQSFGFGHVEQTFYLAVQTMAYLFEHDIRIGILAGVLAHGRDAGKYFVNIGQIEVTAKSQVLGPPVVAAQEGVHIGQSRLAGSGIAQMPHVDFAGKRQALLGITGIGQLFGSQILEVALHRREDFGNGTRTQSTLAEHVFLAGIGSQLDTGQSGSFLSAVVLLFHKQIELVEPVHPRAILLLVIIERL